MARRNATRYKIVVPGNHDLLLEEPRKRAIITNAIALENSGVVIGACESGDRQ